MMRLIKKLNNQEGLGFVEVLISLALVGTAMIIITALSLKSIKIARKSELQDVAVQAAVESLDFVKQPGDLTVDLGGGGILCATSLDQQFFKLEAPAGGGVPTLYLVSAGARLSKTNFSTTYLNSFLEEQDYEVYQQIYLVEEGNIRFKIESIVVWKIVGDYKEETLDGYRYGAIRKINCT